MVKNIIWDEFIIVDDDKPKLLKEMKALLSEMKITKEVLKDTTLKNVIFKFKYQKAITSLETAIRLIEELLHMEDMGFHR